MVDARRDVLRAVHDHARQHRRERRPAVDPERPRRLDLRASSGRSTATRCPSRCCWRPAGGSATSSAAAACSSIGVVIFALSSATAGLAPDETALVVSRVVQGVGAALMMPGTLSIITDAFPAHERGKAMGTWAGVSALALAIGPVLGGFLTEHVSWRAIFYLNIPVAIGAVAGDPLRRARVARHLRRPRGRLRRRRRPDRRPDRAGPRPRRGQQLGLGLDRRSSPCSRSRSSRCRSSSRSRTGSRRRWSSSTCSPTATSSARSSSP